MRSRQQELIGFDVAPTRVTSTGGPTVRQRMCRLQVLADQRWEAGTSDIP